jgi:hypothetical protein
VNQITTQSLEETTQNERRSFLLVQLPLDKRFGDVTRACLGAVRAFLTEPNDDL